MQYIEAAGLNIDGTSSEAEGCDWGDIGKAPPISRDIGVARTGYRGRSCPLSVVSYRIHRGARKHQAKAHFSLSRVGDYPISLTLTSFTSSGEFNNEFFSKLVI